MTDSVLRINITDDEFAKFSDLIYKLAGINLSDGKKALVVSRLSKRLREYETESFSDYYKIVKNDKSGKEIQVLIDLLTTNETYFFRENKHFDFLKNIAKEAYKPSVQFRVWSAASSSGEEAYSIAMEMYETLGKGNWEVYGTDINQTVINSALDGVYSLERCRYIPKEYLEKYCLKGVRSHAGSVMVKKILKQRVLFERKNLLEDLPNVGFFDAIFLRNIMIYFDMDTKIKLVDRLTDRLKLGGYFFVGHSESLGSISKRLTLIQPSIYQLQRK
ncbi:MAG: SAM-dependent methyltransferase [Gammaproteobacteria bacterium]|nr:SAM-dependent methyltransferase [Gammaproteobacteria bacterium]MDH5693656.1 SAM-dependent methyltransferase [Gammaproteobacteria bacterium]